MVCSENATNEEKSGGGGRTLAFSIDSIMSDHGTKPARVSAATSRPTNHRLWKTVDDNAMTPEAEIVAHHRGRNKPEAVSRNDAAVVRYHLHQQKMKLANAVMLHMATTGSGMATADRLLPVPACQPEVLLRQYHPRHPTYHPQSERYHQNAATNISSLPVTSSFGRCSGRLPISSPEVTWPPSSNRGSEYQRSPDKPKFLSSESLFSPARSTIGRKRTRDVTNWSQMATESLQRRHRPSPTGSPLSTISGCSAEGEIVVDDDVDDHRKQFWPASEEHPVERPEVVNDGDSSWTGRTGDCRDTERRSPETRLKPPAWSVIYAFLSYTCLDCRIRIFTSVKRWDFISNCRRHQYSSGSVLIS